MAAAAPAFQGLGWTLFEIFAVFALVGALVVRL